MLVSENHWMLAVAANNRIEKEKQIYIYIYIYIIYIYTKTASNRNEISEQLAPVRSTKLHTVLAAAASNRNEK